MADGDREQRCDAHWVVSVQEGWTVRDRWLPCIRSAGHDGNHRGQLGNGDLYDFPNSYGVRPRLDRG